MMLKVLLAIVLIAEFGTAVLPPHVKVCSRNSPQIAACLKNAIDVLKPYLKNGYIAPDFIIEGLDPLLIGDFSINRGFNMNLIKMNIFGISNFNIEKIRVSIADRLKLDLILTIPQLSTKSLYSLNWMIGLLNIQGKGDGYANLGNLRILLKIVGSRYLRQGVEYIKIDEVKFKIKPGSLRVRFENLFNGNKELENVGNEVINQNINLITDDIIPQIERALEAKTMRIANQVFERAPSTEFFPY